MQIGLQRVSVIAAVVFSAFIVLGCDHGEEVKQQSATSSIPVVSASAGQQGSQSETVVSEPAQQQGFQLKAEADLSEVSTYKLIVNAEKALYKNDVETALAAISEARQRENLNIGMKLDIAKLLFGAGEMKESAAVYDEVLSQQPDIKPQLWQRGLALYYAEEFEKGVDQFDTHQTFNSQDVENSVWHLLCQSRLTSVEEARKSMIQIEEDLRIPMKQVFDMFAGKGSPEQVIAASGYNGDNIVRNGSNYHGWLYVGLFHEMMGDQEAANEAMKKALKCKPIIPSLMGYVADGHLRVRGAFPSSKD